MSRLSPEKKREAAAVVVPLDVRVPGAGTAGATIGGMPVGASDDADIHQAVLRHLHRIALATGHPVLATVHDSRIGYVVPLRVDTDGASHFTGEPVRMGALEEATRPTPDSAPAFRSRAVPRAEPAGVAASGTAAAPGAASDTGGRAVAERALPACPSVSAAPGGGAAAAPGTAMAPIGVFGPPPRMDATPEPVEVPAPAEDPAPALAAESALGAMAVPVPEPGPVPGAALAPAPEPGSAAGSAPAPAPKITQTRVTSASSPDPAHTSAPTPASASASTLRPGLEPAAAPIPTPASASASTLRPGLEPAAAPIPTPASASVSALGPGPRPAPAPESALVLGLDPDPKPTPTPTPTPARGFDAVAEAVLAGEGVDVGGRGQGGGPAVLGEPVARVNEAVRVGRIDEAGRIAERTVVEASGTLGPEHPEVLRLRELTAYIAYLADDPVRALHISLDLAGIHRRSGDAEAAYGNVQSAAAAWRAVRDPFQGLNLGNELLGLWTALAGEEGPAADDVEELESARARMLRLAERAARKSAATPGG
ncbi:tetratricopeptide repeat protein [Streptomyces sp. NPDC018693]|uniref:tetratricopeptide repeat protein n=1 Tax=unclassified Streptomyces TaxID=2593676 RepID=UPI00379F0043